MVLSTFVTCWFIASGVMHRFAVYRDGPEIDGTGDRMRRRPGRAFHSFICELNITFSIAMAKIYVHCGLHKTGSTAIQIVLSANAERLKSLGFLFPLAGRVDRLGGHHNIAWELAQDRRFDRSLGDLDALFAEIGNFSGDVIVSCEDAEGLIGHQKKWLPLQRRAQHAKRDVVLVVYVRNQISYLESLYQELIRYDGCGDEYGVFADSALVDGKVRLKEWEFHFDYWRAATLLSRLHDFTVVFRNYHTLFRQSPVLDFMSVVGLDPSPFELASNERVNVRDSLGVSLLRFYQNRVKRALDIHEDDVVRRLCDTGVANVCTNGELREALQAKFSNSNQQLCEYFNLSTEGLLVGDGLSPEIDPVYSMQRVFSFKTQVAIRDLSRLLAQASVLSNSDIESEVVTRVREWSSWVKGD